MATMAAKEPLTSKKYIDGIYIPAGLLIFGVWICKDEWLPYAIALTLALSAIKFWRTRKWHMFRLDDGRGNPPSAETDQTS